MTRRLVGFALFVLFAALLAPSSLEGQDRKKRPAPKKAIPAALKEALDKAEKVVLYSLEPSDKAGKKDFHGWTVLGKVELKDKDTRAKTIKAVTESLAVGSGAMCFRPRHGLRLERKGKSVDLVICFECSSVRVYGL